MIVARYQENSVSRARSQCTFMVLSIQLNVRASDVDLAFEVKTKWEASGRSSHNIKGGFGSLYKGGFTPLSCSEGGVNRIYSPRALMPPFTL